MMSMVGSGRMIMDDLLFHELWLASRKFKDFENEESETDEENEDSEVSDDEDSKNVRNLFRKEQDEKKEKKRSKSIASTSSSTEWFAIGLGIFFIASLAGLASYQAFKSDFSGELSHVSVFHNGITSNDYAIHNGITNSDFPVAEGTYNEVSLPGNILPSAYVLYMNVDIKNQNYTGLVKITLLCLDNLTNQIILHSSMTNNHKVEVRKRDGNKVDISDIMYNPHREMMIITLEQNLTAFMNYSLFISFDKPLSYSANDGFYLSKFVDGDGNKQIMVSTVFEPTAARKTFPCFDEPRFKATFHVVIQHEKIGLVADSNMPAILKLDLDDTRMETHFQTTPPMCTYLVGWQISGMVYKETMIQDNLPLRVYAPQGRLDETDFALEVGPLCLRFYEEHFKINYALPKLDLYPVTLLNAGADEVWGMIVFSEELLLYNRKTSEVIEKEAVAGVVCHEISHQWFGDLVSIYEWNDLWLKESFAAYLQTQPIAKHFPTWDVATMTYVNVYTSGLSFDSSIYTHPIYSEEKDPVKLRFIYDSITYEKGASVLEMMAKYLGDDVFYEGVHKFLKKYEYSNAHVDQFWEAFSEVVPDINVTQMMRSWVKEPGYPVVLFDVVNNTEFVVRQDRFVFQNESLVASMNSNFSADTIWDIPIDVFVKYEGETINQTKLTLEEREAKFPINTTGFSWYKANYGSTGYYRVYYSRENWLALLNVLKTEHEILATVDRAALLSDVAGFANYKYMTLDASLEFTLYLNKEHKYGPWIVGLEQLTGLRKLFYDTPLKACFDRYIDKQITPVLDFLNSKKIHTHDQLKLIPVLLQEAVSVGKQPLTNDFYLMFLEWLVRDGNEKLPSTARSAILEAGIKKGQSYEWDSLFHKYRTSTLRDQLEILEILAMTPDENLVIKLLNYTNNPDLISGSLAQRVVQFACANPVGRNEAWEVLQKKFKMWYKEGSQILWYALENCLGSGKTTKDLEEAQNFLKKENVEDVRPVRRYVESIQYNIELVKQYQLLLRWFQKHDAQCTGA